MAITTLDHINIRTMKMEETRDFYVEVLGMEVGERPPFRNPGYWLYSNGYPTVHLSPSEPDSPRRTDPDGMGDGFDHFAFNGEGLPDLLEKLDARGVVYETQLAANDRIVQVFFLDPNGARIEIGYDIDAEGLNRGDFKSSRA